MDIYLEKKSLGTKKDLITRYLKVMNYVVNVLGAYNMKLTKAQQNDLETIIYFIPSSCRKHTDEDIREFFVYSERGIEPKQKDNPLIEGKRWRGIHIHEMYEQGILDGSVPYIVILENTPRSVVDFMKKEMFKGRDADLIEKVYKLLALKDKK